MTYTFFESEVVTVALTNRELAERSQAVAANLQMLNVFGERVLLLLPPSLDYIVAFFGCLCAGAIAVPAYPPHPNRSVSRLRAITKDSQPTVVLTTHHFLKTLNSSKEHLLNSEDLAWLTLDEMSMDRASQWQQPSIGGHSLAFLQYTSGSTAAPKGVMVSHHNLLHNLGLISQHFEASAQSQGVIWLPPYHDMGLIGGILQPLYAGFPVALMPPVNFLQQPIRWLRAISQCQANISGGPNFAYELCLSRISPEARETLDLSSWDIAFTGAETIRAGTLDRFAEAFEPCGFRREAFYPCYGMAEATLFVSGGQKKSPPIYQFVSSKALRLKQVVLSDRQDHDSSTLVGCGQTDLSQTIVIADPETCHRCVQHQVGEIWVSGPSITQGYWTQPKETQESFHAYLADTQAGPFLRTGDLGFLQNGELFVTGRLKDLIIIRGHNHYPQDIELTVERSHPALRAGCGAAFAVDADAEERLVVVQEVERRYLRKLDGGAVAQAVRRAIAQHHDLQVYAILFLRTGSIPKTSSGKIQRYACKQGFQTRTLNVVGDWFDDSPHRTTLVQSDCGASEQQVISMGAIDAASQEKSEKQVLKNSPSEATSVSASIIAHWLIVRLAQRLKVAASEINVHEPFSSYGLDSAAAVSLSGELEDWLERRLSPTLVYDYPSIAQLAQYLAMETVATGTVATGTVATGTISDIPIAQADSGHKTQAAIAVVGMECRFPGAENLDAFWKLLQAGRDAITAVPGDRWHNAGTRSAGGQGSNTLTTRMGGFLEAVDQFDAAFFGIAPREATKMDPQQRWLLEVAWAALENAGQSPAELAGTLTGVFIGTSSSDYGRLLDNTQLDAYVGTGNAPSIAANRLSYCLHLQGPSLAIDTACSSSLVAVHLACQSLRQGECNLALVGGVNALLTPDLSVAFAKAQMLAADGRCKTFDVAADGYGRSEGCGVVVLKRLADAEQAGDRILAVIHGSAINQDGRSNGLTAPNGPAQQAVIRQALDNAGIAPAAIQYVEAHGTGTPLGDPIEVAALQAVLGHDRAIAQRCAIGSVKTNIGHLEAAAGIAGLMKVVLALHHQQIPPHLHLNQLNPQVILEGTPFFIPTQTEAWPDTPSFHFAGVSSFGFGGTNAHVVLGATSRNTSPTPELPVPSLERPYHLLTLSAKTESALRQLLECYGRLAAASPADLSDICFSANTGRAHFSQRLAIVASSKVDLAEHLTALSNEAKIFGLTSVQPDPLDQPKVAFLFTGQGSQYVDMGRQLYETQPTFRAALEQCDAILQPYLERSLLSLLYPDQRLNAPVSNEAPLIHQTVYTQPALFALEYALAQLWRSWGIEPDVVMGHSVGEYVAACIAGVFSLEDGLKLIAHRGRLMQSLPANGAMAVVMAGAEQLSALLESFNATINSTVAIAAINGPQNVVLSGEAEPLDQLLQHLTETGIKTTRLEVSHAFHSPLVEPILEPFRRIAETVDFAVPRIPIISNLTGRLATEAIATPDYWVRHVRHPVQFSQGMVSLHQQQCAILIEVGPKPVLLGMGHHCLPQKVSDAMLWLPSLRTGREDWSVLLASLASLYRAGIAIDWRGFDRDYQRQRVPLPTYPFQRQRYWVQPHHSLTSTAALALQGTQSETHPLLGQRLEPPAHCPDDYLWQINFHADHLSYLQGHRIWQTPTLSLGTYIEMALAAAQSIWGQGSHQLQQLALHQPLLLPHLGLLDQSQAKSHTTIQIRVADHADGKGQFQVHSRRTIAGQRSPWILHATADLKTGTASDGTPVGVGVQSSNV
ncbi:MAG: beta-ketoacyl synthase N-terminal-like domain-containing protein [Synechococcales bacterium]|nr:beta-ketoacyl synthase N-terminal-like domain-containing protein [Synechococcales bacterium]